MMLGNSPSKASSIMENKFDLTTIRQQFPTLHGPAVYAYLDSASSSLTPEPVLAAMDNYYRDYRANVHRGLYRASELATEAYEAARITVARFINAKNNEIIFTRGTTESLNLVARGLDNLIEVGDEVVLTTAEHHANLVPWQQLAQRRGAQLRFVPLNNELNLDLTAFTTSLTTKTKIVSLQWVSNVIGIINPLEKLIPQIRSAAPNAIIVIDAAQMAGHRRIDVERLGADFVAFSGHKCYGPTGIGVLWGNQSSLEKLQPVMFGGDMIDEVTLTNSTWSEIPRRFEAGTPNIAGAIGLGAAVKFIEAVGLKNIEQHEQELTSYATQQLKSVNGIKTFIPSGETLGIISFSIDGIHPHDVATVFDSQKVAVRAGFHCAMPLCHSLGAEQGLVRLSLGMYSTKADIDQLIAAINRSKQTFQL